MNTAIPEHTTSLNLIFLAEGLVQRVISSEYREESCSQKCENSLGDRVAETIPLCGVSVKLCFVESQNDRVLNVKDLGGSDRC
jgi:hypothetical protein